MRLKLAKLYQVRGKAPNPEHDFNSLLDYIDRLEDRVKELEINSRMERTGLPPEYGLP